MKTEIEGILPNQDLDSNLLKCRFESEKAQIDQIIGEIDQNEMQHRPWDKCWSDVVFTLWSM